MSSKIFVLRHPAFAGPIFVKAANRARARRYIFEGCVAEPATTDEIVAASACHTVIHDGTAPAAHEVDAEAGGMESAEGNAQNGSDGKNGAAMESLFRGTSAAVPSPAAAPAA